MKLAIISDLHLGDKTCVLVEQNAGQWRVAPGVAERLQPLRDADLLVLLGDVFDLSIAGFKDAFSAAKPFFELLRQMGVRRMLYVPGNHDSMVWHALEYETRVVRPISLGEPPGLFRSVQPAVIRLGSTGVEVSLPGLSNPPGDVFLKSLMGEGVVVAYPNAYLVTPGQTVLLTHGQYFEGFWAVAGELVHEAARPELPAPSDMTMRRIVEFNHPLSQLSCTGIGQAGELTDIARWFQQDVKEHRVGPGTRVHRYLSRAAAFIRRFPDYSGVLGGVEEVAFGITTQLGMTLLERSLAKAEPARDNEEWLEDRRVARRLEAFLRACALEVAALDAAQPTLAPVGIPTHLVFGHTHEPIPWARQQLVEPRRAIGVCNTGGWLDWTKAQILLHDDAGFHSHAVH